PCWVPQWWSGPWSPVSRGWTCWVVPFRFGSRSAMTRAWGAEGAAPYAVALRWATRRTRWRSRTKATRERSFERCVNRGGVTNPWRQVSSRGASGCWLRFSPPAGQPLPDGSLRERYAEDAVRLGGHDRASGARSGPGDDEDGSAGVPVPV